MNDTICNQVRLEIDEAQLSASLSVAAKEHLKTCGACKEFHSKETKLRHIIGSLEPVNAPADFDFRLRARLANDRSLASRYTPSPLRLLRSRSFAVAAMLLIFAATVVMVRQASRQDPVIEAPALVGDTSPPDSRAPAAIPNKPTERPTSSSVAAVNDATKPVRPRRAPTVVNKRPLATFEPANTAAPVIRNEQSMATMATFPLDVSKQSFKVSLDDAHGASKTIFVPNVSFGAGRALTGTAPVNQFAPKGDW